MLKHGYLEIFASDPFWLPRAQALAARTYVQMVLDVISTSPRKVSGEKQALIAKAKSMVSEEIGLNHALEAAGHRVVETDLGEYIVQLRHERPAHIITPAVRLRRHQVGELFHEKLGIAYTENIHALTATARSMMREIFLKADVGISGVNFAVAETGALTLVTNEGNGRMSTTLPPVHIALMGMERLLPTLDDPALFISLLPRSATGQKMSVYTQIIHRPLQGQQRHLMIVDNGRIKDARIGLARRLILHSLWRLPQRLPGFPRNWRSCLYGEGWDKCAVSRPNWFSGFSGTVWGKLCRIGAGFNALWRM